MPDIYPSSGAAIRWWIIAAGLAAAVASLLVSGQPDMVATSGTGALAAALDAAAVFAPLLVLALTLGLLSRVRVVRAGNQSLLWWFVGSIVGAGGLLVTIGYSWLNGGLVISHSSQALPSIMCLGLAVTLFQVGCEELFFRGWLQPMFIAQLGPVAGIAATAAVFALFHLLGGTRDWLSLLNLTLGGGLFGLLAYRSGGLLAPLAAHFGWNAIEDQVFGLVPNPGVGPLGSLLNGEVANGAEWWGGAQDGLNGSLGTTIVLVALIVPLLDYRAGEAGRSPPA